MSLCNTEAFHGISPHTGDAQAATGVVPAPATQGLHRSALVIVCKAAGNVTEELGEEERAF